MRAVLWVVFFVAIRAHVASVSNRRCCSQTSPHAVCTLSDNEGGLVSTMSCKEARGGAFFPSLRFFFFTEWQLQGVIASHFLPKPPRSMDDATLQLKQKSVSLSTPGDFGSELPEFEEFTVTPFLFFLSPSSLPSSRLLPLLSYFKERCNLILASPKNKLPLFLDANLRCLPLHMMNKFFLDLSPSFLLSLPITLSPQTQHSVNFSNLFKFLICILYINFLFCGFSNIW